MIWSSLRMVVYPTASSRASLTASCTSRTVLAPLLHSTPRIANSALVGRIAGRLAMGPIYEALRTCQYEALRTSTAWILGGNVDRFYARAERHARADVADRARIFPDVVQDIDIGPALRRGNADTGEGLLLPPGLHGGDGTLMDALGECATHRR